MDPSQIPKGRSAERNGETTRRTNLKGVYFHPESGIRLVAQSVAAADSFVHQGFEFESVFDRSNPPKTVGEAVLKAADLQTQLSAEAAARAEAEQKTAEALARAEAAEKQAADALAAQKAAEAKAKAASAPKTGKAQGTSKPAVPGGDSNPLANTNGDGGNQ